MSIAASDNCVPHHISNSRNYNADKMLMNSFPLFVKVLDTSKLIQATPKVNRSQNMNITTCAIDPVSSVACHAGAC